MMTATHGLSKADLRDLALARRSLLTETEQRTRSQAAAGRMAGLIKPGEDVALFLPIRGEIDTGPLIETVRERHGRRRSASAGLSEPGLPGLGAAPPVNR